MWGTRGCLLTLLVLVSTPVIAAPDVPPRVAELSEAGGAALDKGLAWLVKHQQPDGSWIADSGYKLNSGYIVTERKVGHVGVTALAGMALLWSGRDPEGEHLQSTPQFVLSCASRDGDGMITKHDTRMYSHAFATLFLVEMFRVTGDEKTGTAARQAVRFSLRSQCRTGGWGYAPHSQRPDLTFTPCQLLALRAAKHAGIRVPKEALDRAVRFAVGCANRGGGPGNGSFQYLPIGRSRSRSSFPLTAAGLLALLGADLRTDEDMLAFLRKDGVADHRDLARAPDVPLSLIWMRNTYATTPRRHYFYWFGNLFAVQAMHMAGGREWTDYFARVQRDLVEDQEEGGHWPDRHVGPAFATASGCLILLVPRIPVVPALAR